MASRHLTFYVFHKRILKLQQTASRAASTFKVSADGPMGVVGGCMWSSTGVDDFPPDRARMLRPYTRRLAGGPKVHFRLVVPYLKVYFLEPGKFGEGLPRLSGYI